MAKNVVKQRDRVFSHKQACRYLGIHKNTLMKRIKAGWVTPLRMENNSFIYTEHMLIEMQLRMAIGTQECTIDMLAAYYGRHRDTVAATLNVAGVKPLRTVGNLQIYNAKETNRVARSKGWFRELDTGILKVAVSARSLQRIGTFSDDDIIRIVHPDDAQRVGNRDTD